MNRMSIHYGILAIFWFWLIFFPPQPNLQVSAIPTIRAGFVLVDCEELIEGMIKDQDWYDQLIDPVLFTTEEVSEKIAYYSEVQACLN